jgi:esterase/lipase superfamily enzyme
MAMLNNIPAGRHEARPTQPIEWLRIERKTLYLLFAFGLASCASAPENLFVPVSQTASGVSAVDMLVATTRRSAENPGELYTGERSSALTFANIVVSVPPDSVRIAGEVQWPGRLPGNPATDFVTTKVRRLDLNAARAWLDSHGTAIRKHRVLVFVHGYNNRFGDAVFRFAQFVHDSDVKVTPILFTWPSRGNVFAYGYDRESASLSRDAFEQLLNMLVRDAAIEKIDILAHSMGNFLVLETLRQMALRNRAISTKIDDVMLAAPDVDVDGFESELADMGSPHPKFTLFASRDDKALALSGWIWGSEARLGAIDPKAEPYKSRLAAEHVNVFDLTDIKSTDAANHNKFVQSPELVRLVGDRLASGQTLSDLHESVVDQFLGATASEVGALETAVEKAETDKSENPAAK